MTAPPRLARLATNVHFFLNGLAFATWGVHVPTFKRLHGLTDAEVAMAMLAAGVGALFAVLWAGFVIGRYGQRLVCAIAGVLNALAIGSILLMPSYAWGVCTLFVFGIANSLYDVATNAHAVEVENAYDRPIMSSCHGFFSSGGLFGALLASLLALTDVKETSHTVGIALLAILLTLSVIPVMLPNRASEEAPAGHTFVRPHGMILLLGSMAALGLVVEGAMYDWSVLYLRDSLSSPQSVAALAYGAFSVAMAAGRFTGDRARARFGPATLLSAGAGLAGCSMVVVLLVGDPIVALIGFALMGFGIANIVPVLFACASRVPNVTPAHGIAGVASIGYLGFLSGPPVIGALADVTSLSLALGLVTVFSLLLSVMSRKTLAGFSAAYKA